MISWLKKYIYYEKTYFGTFSKEVRRVLLRNKTLIFYIYIVRGS